MRAHLSGLLPTLLTILLLSFISNQARVAAQDAEAQLDFWRPVVDSSAASGSVSPVNLSSQTPTVAWGWDHYGQVSGQMDPPFDVIRVAAGRDHTVALRASGKVEAWGSNSSGQSAVPVDLLPVRDIAAGFYFTLAILEDRTLTGWGANGQGQLNFPEDLGPVVQADGGYDFTVALEADGSVRAWGGNSWGQLNIPPDLGKVSQVAASERHVIALLADGSVVMWGAQTSVPADLGDVKMIAGGYHRSAALTNDGIRVWGSGSLNIPAGVGNTDNFSLGAGFIQVRFNDGTVGSWGSNPYGPLHPPPDIPSVRHVATGAFHSVAAAVGSTLTPQSLLGIDRTATLSVHPNPSSVHSTVTFYSNGLDHVTIEIIDLLGRSTMRLIERHYDQGWHQVAWSSSGLPNGKYIIQLRNGDTLDTMMVSIVR